MRDHVGFLREVARTGTAAPCWERCDSEKLRAAADEMERLESENARLAAEVADLRQWKHLTQNMDPYPAAFATLRQEVEKLTAENADLRARLDATENAMRTEAALHAQTEAMQANMIEDLKAEYRSLRPNRS